MKRMTSGLALFGALAALPATAHHSFDGAFDRSEQVRLSGTVTKFSFGNPHAYFKLSVVGRDGANQEWHIETTNPNALERQGWTSDSIKPGQALIVEGWPSRTGRPYMRLRAMTHADSTPVALWLPAGPSPLPSS